LNRFVLQFRSLFAQIFDNDSRWMDITGPAW
jgi:hypothetical protein